MYHDRIKEEDERLDLEYYESIGVFGRLIMNEYSYCAILLLLANVSLWVGFGIAQLL